MTGLGGRTGAGSHPPTLRSKRAGQRNILSDISRPEMQTCRSGRQTQSMVGRGLYKRRSAFSLSVFALWQ